MVQCRHGSVRAWQCARMLVRGSVLCVFLCNVGTNFNPHNADILFDGRPTPLAHKHTSELVRLMERCVVLVEAKVKGYKVKGVPNAAM